MVRRRSVLWSLALALALLAPARAETLVNTDFSKGAEGWALNGAAQLLDPQTAGVPQLLSLTQNDYAQTGVAWTEIQRRAPSFSFTADVRIRHQGDEFSQCPADGMALVFAPVDTSAMGGGGGGLGIFGIEQFTAFEINTYSGQGLGEGNCFAGGNVTFGFDVIYPGVDAIRSGGEQGTPEAGGAKIGQIVPPAGMIVVNGGFYRYQWNVAADGTMAVYATGLEERNREFQKVKILEVKFPDNKAIDFEGRWGFAAATGGAYQHAEALSARIDVPMIDPL